jgi:DNA (cytosine-5)-methyltransferase 1
MKSLELFVGAGGLALGMGNAGFAPTSVVEWNGNACDTIRLNQSRGIPLVTDWKLHQGDARKFDYRSIQDEVAVIAGGPPCQPFSLGGNHKAYNDERDLFPEAVRAVRELKPKAFIFENVKGLLRSSFATYVEYIYLQMSYPDVVRRPAEDWAEHLSRLERLHTAARRKPSAGGVKYRVVYRLLNAANYGVPQKRERVFFVGFREDLGFEWSFPDATHSHDSLLVDQWVTGEYWDRHKVSTRARSGPSAKLLAKINLLRSGDLGLPQLAPWQTVRDAIRDLPDPEKYRVNDIPNHTYWPGARVYAGHTGSPFDEPSKTLKAGDHGVPGGENMIAFPGGSYRYFTVREAARMQTFPDHFAFSGSWGETMRQLGNAVPVRLGEAVALSVARTLRRPARSTQNLH